MEFAPDAPPIVRPPQRKARVHWLPLPVEWRGALRSWITQGRDQDAVAMLLPFRSEPWAQALLGEVRWKDERKRRKAFAWFRRAASDCADDDPVLVRLGWCYAHGIGTSKNPLLAWRWFKRAAVAEVHDALEALADLEATELLWPVNRVRASMWLAICSSVVKDEQRSKELQNKLFDVSYGLSSAEIDWIFDGGLQWMADNWTE